MKNESSINQRKDICINTVPELNLLTLLIKKELYARYNSYIDRQYLKDNYKELSYLYTVLDDLHNKSDSDISLVSFRTYFFVKYEEADRDTYNGIFDQLEKIEIDPSIGEVILNEIATRKRALALSEAAFRFSNGTGELTKIQEAINDFGEAPKRTTEEEFVSTDLNFLLQDTMQKRGLRWRLEFLNKALGSLRKGDFGFYFARVETGKSVFMSSELSFMLEQLQPDDGPILLCNNEEQGSKVMLGIYQALFGVTKEQLYSNMRKYDEEYQARFKGKLLVLDNASITKQQVESICEKYKPSLIWFDQLDKVKGFNNEREDLRLGGIYIWARELAKRYCPVVGVCQANGTAEGRDWLTMDQVANATTSKQAEADWIIGIGKTHAETAEFVRYFSVVKNKLVGDHDSIEAMRHGRQTVLIEPTVRRYSDLRRYD